MADRYRNIGGHHRRPDGSAVGQGEVFEPTSEELDKVGDKLEPVSSSAPVQGADIGLRALDWGSDAALDRALDADLTTDEMREVGATGSTGFVTSDVDRALEARDE